MISNVPTLDHIQQFHSNSHFLWSNRLKQIYNSTTATSVFSIKFHPPFHSKKVQQTPIFLFKINYHQYFKSFKFNPTHFFLNKKPTFYETFSTPQTIIQLPLPQSSQTQPNYNFRPVPRNQTSYQILSIQSPQQFQQNFNPSPKIRFQQNDNSQIYGLAQQLMYQSTAVANPQPLRNPQLSTMCGNDTSSQTQVFFFWIWTFLFFN